MPIKPIIEKYQKYFEIKTKPTYDGFLSEEERTNVVYHKDFTLQDIINELDYSCPNCILAIIRCLGLNRYYFGEKFKFKYKEALENWWAIINNEAREEDEWSVMHY